MNRLLLYSDLRRPSMALAGVEEALTSVVLKEVLCKLGSAIGQQIKARWNLERDMKDITSMLGIVKAVLRDVERRSVREEAVNLWLKIKDAAYEISDMFDEFEVKFTKVNLLLDCAIKERKKPISLIIISYLVS